MATIALAARAYQQSFDTRPYTTLALTNGTLSAVGDCVAQIGQMATAKRQEHEDEPRYDLQRTLRFFTFGFAMGPLLGRWNKFLEKRFPLRAEPPKPGVGTFNPLSAGVQFGPRSPHMQAPLNVPIGQVPRVSGLAVAKRVAADQLFMAPIGLALFIGAMGMLEGRDAAHIKRKYVDLYPSALAANWQVWPLAQIVNFRYMPLAARVPFQATCGIFWNLYLSLLNARENQEEQKEEAMHKTVG
ncbi:uncharacterized protein FOMMEDRAFT_83316 [Fomitiporia mediterranea MF3/22]|uniref:uncharacterized protein n=1 Tax=Fomitiporia mediterranea (strain MF3/22) TaxID=694068 RepID=UPI00044080C1|nr:uncharacterized protein FOMMEDRAFT_83316 [Fomitiporia mediterranea MF3/22]EJD04375.1 hypothetical protein FOMMEDRAFT_83316 [Fomitiporia mediterranea MF3/22]